MYKCALCGKTSDPREKAGRTVIERREKIYTREVENGPPIILGRGMEIVKEIVICSISCEERADRPARLLKEKKEKKRQELSDKRQAARKRKQEMERKNKNKSKKT